MSQLRDLRERVQALVAERPYRFRDTTRADAEAYLAGQARIEGCSDAEIAAAEDERGAAFPATYRDYLWAMGRKPGLLFIGSALCEMDRRDYWWDVADSILARAGLDGLPKNAVIILVHQGYSCDFLLAYGGEDAPVFRVSDDDSHWHVLAPSFGDYLEREFRSVEEAHRITLETGGYYLTVRDGMVTQSHPSLASGERPIDTDDMFAD